MSDCNDAMQSAEGEDCLAQTGWTLHPSAARLGALAALRALPPAEPVARVSYISKGRLLIVGNGEQAAQAAELLKSSLDVHLLVPTGQADATDGCLRWIGVPTEVAGWLGAFRVTWPAPQHAQAQSIPLAQAGDDVVVSAAGGECHGVFDLLLDFSEPPLFAMAQTPQGYLNLSRVDAASRPATLVGLADLVGEFEKPKFFAYKSSLCAHSRSRKPGCNQCIDICSTRAISPDGDHVKVEPYLCMGCGACATVCPSGAMAYQYPRLADRGLSLKSLVGAYVSAGGRSPMVLVHNIHDGRDLLAKLAANSAGLADAVLPHEAWHVAAIGMDVLLTAVCYGARHVAVLAAGSETGDYLAALEREMDTAQTILSALGYRGRHFSVIRAGSIDTLAGALGKLSPADVPAVAATFNLGNDKRTAIEFAVEHLLKHARSPQQEIALAVGAAFGTLKVDTAACTLCMACAGACPESALMDSPDLPRLKFLERNCVQCGLCVNTCPENAITMVPRLLLTPERRQEVVLNAAEPFPCIRCAKPLGTRQMIDSMLSRLSGHSMFQSGAQLTRLQMCADCRIIDMMENKDEMSILTGAGKP